MTGSKADNYHKNIKSTKRILRLNYSILFLRKSLNYFLFHFFFFWETFSFPLWFTCYIKVEKGKWRQRFNLKKLRTGGTRRENFPVSGEFFQFSAIFSSFRQVFPVSGENFPVSGEFFQFSASFSSSRREFSSFRRYFPVSWKFQISSFRRFFQFPAKIPDSGDAFFQISMLF